MTLFDGSPNPERAFERPRRVKISVKKWGRFWRVPLWVAKRYARRSPALTEKLDESIRQMREMGFKA